MPPSAPKSQLQNLALDLAALQSFSIGFDQRDIPRVLADWEQILTSSRWSEGPFTERFEHLWSEWNGLPALATSSWSAAALAALQFIGVEGECVLCPSNTFMATPLSVIQAGGRLRFVDCNREDLCMSYDDFVAKAKESKPKAAWLVHIGGHIAFDVERIADYCRRNGIRLLEDCAHAHGAEWNSRKPGTWGDAGVCSFYATKTISTGEGGMLVSRHPEMLEFARVHRNYGKPDYSVHGLNGRISEFTAALGCAQTERMPEIVAWKRQAASELLDPRYPHRVRFPEGMHSGYYKYVVFEPIERSTGKVYDSPCHRILKDPEVLPNTDWVADHHWCVPIYYSAGTARHG